MKSFVIYVSGHTESERYMKECIKSCKGSGFEAEPFNGVTPFTLSEYQEFQYDDLVGSRIEGFRKQNQKTYLTKKACFTNHVRLWNKCIEFDTPIAVIEQDSHCVMPWDNTAFNDVLILNINSAFNQKVFNHIKKKPNLYLGVNDYGKQSEIPLTYYKNSRYKGSFMMPGTAAYAVTPAGAKKLLSAVDKYGWEQSDFIINTDIVNIQYKMPEYFTFKLKNLNMSHGY